MTAITICRNRDCGTSRNTLALIRGIGPYLVDRYSERKESAEALSRRVNQRSI